MGPQSRFFSKTLQAVVLDRRDELSNSERVRFSDGHQHRDHARTPADAWLYALASMMKRVNEHAKQNVELCL